MILPFPEFDRLGVSFGQPKIRSNYHFEPLKMSNFAGKP